MKNYYYVLFALILGILFSLNSLSAANFDAGMIISDEELLSVNTMSVEDIQFFLDSHSGVLSEYVDIDVDGLLKTAAMIIHDAAERNHINPQYLLVLLQKEQGLITDSEPYQSQLDWATGYAVCDTCDVDHPVVQEYKGFAKQLEKAAWRTRYYIEHIEQFTFKPGFEYEIDGQEVFIKNIATAALYNYTPHIRGNQIFSKLWRSWFYSLYYPTGTLLQAYGEPGVWLIRDGVRHAFKTKSALTSRYSLNQVIQVPIETIEQYPIGAPIGYAEFSLLRIPSGKIFLLVDNELRWIVDQDTFRQLGYMPDEIEQVTEAELAFFAEGAPISQTTLEPLGSLVQDPETFGIYFVKNGIKAPLIAPELLSLNYPNMVVRKGSMDELNRYQKGTPVLLKDGLLVKINNDPTVYVTSNGQLLPIDSEFTFNSLGYNWHNINIISEGLRNIHKVGTPITVESPISDIEAEELVNLEN